MMVMGTMKKSSDDDSKRYGGAERIPQYADSGRVYNAKREREKKKMEGDLNCKPCLLSCKSALLKQGNSFCMFDG